MAKTKSNTFRNIKPSAPQITVVESEAGTVRYIFKRYLELGSISALLTDLKKADIRTKRRTLSTGKTIGGIPFGRGALGYLLRNRFYIGEVKYKGEILWGEQKPIFDRKLFDAVQSKLDAQCNDKKTARITSGALLMGRIFDDRGNRMTPTSKLKKGVRYRYYISTALVQGQPAEAGTVSRAPAELIEKLVTDAVRKQLQQPGSATKTGREGHTNSDARSIIRDHVARVEVLPTTLKVQLSTQAQAGKCKSSIEKPVRLTIPWTKPSSKVAREIIPPLERSQRIDKRPIRAETRAKLILAIAQGRRWVGELIDGVVTSIQEIATREGCSLRQVNRAMTLAFLSPHLVEAAIGGKLPRGIGVASIHQLPAEWSKQHTALGLKF